ncbi:hypothetical protein SNEBB_008267 [Seison nebaliae]|nr:hypothetical protein SNEBB_008267 [Seison nebaliae]
MTLEPLPMRMTIDNQQSINIKSRFLISNSIASNSTYSVSDIAIRSIIGAILAFIIIITIAGNLLVIISVLYEKSLRASAGLFIMSLATADLIVGVFVMPLNWIFEFYGHHQWLFGRGWCCVWRSADVFASTASILDLCVIALDRYWAITNPITYPLIMTKTRCLTLIILVWLASSLISVPVLCFPTDSNTYKSITQIFMIHNTTLSSINHTNDDRICEFSPSRFYIIMSSLISFYIPLMVMLFLYWRVFVAARHQILCVRRGGIVTCETDKEFVVDDDKRYKRKNLNEHFHGRNHQKKENSYYSNNSYGKNKNSFHTYVPKSSPKLLHSVTKRFRQLTHQPHVNHCNSTPKVTHQIVLRIHRGKYNSAGIGTQTSNGHNDSHSTTVKTTSMQSPLFLVNRSSKHRRQSTIIKLLHRKNILSSSTRLINEKITDPLLRRASIHAINLREKYTMPSIEKEQTRQHLEEERLYLPKLRRYRSFEDMHHRMQHNSHSKKNEEEDCVFLGNNSHSFANERNNRLKTNQTKRKWNFRSDTLERILMLKRLRSKNLIFSSAYFASLTSETEANQTLTKRLVKLSKEQKAAKTLGIVMGIFIICWLPFFILNIVSTFIDVHPIIINILTWLGHVNSCMNTFIYAFSSKDYRKTFLKILCHFCIWRQKKRMIKELQCSSKRNPSIFQRICSFNRNNHPDSQFYYHQRLRHQQIKHEQSKKYRLTINNNNINIIPKAPMKIEKDEEKFDGRNNFRDRHRHERDQINGKKPKMSLLETIPQSTKSSFLFFPILYNVLRYRRQRTLWRSSTNDFSLHQITYHKSSSIDNSVHSQNNQKLRRRPYSHSFHTQRQKINHVNSSASQINLKCYPLPLSALAALYRYNVNRKKMKSLPSKSVTAHSLIRDDETKSPNWNLHNLNLQLFQFHHRKHSDLSNNLDKNDKDLQRLEESKMHPNEFEREQRNLLLPSSASTVRRLHSLSNTRYSRRRLSTIIQS